MLGNYFSRDNEINLYLIPFDNKKVQMDENFKCIKQNHKCTEEKNGEYGTNIF